MRSILSLAISSLLIGCRSDDQTPQSPPTQSVTVAKPLILPIVEWDQYTGRLDAIETVEIRSRVGGYLESVHFEEGQEVRQGDLLAVVDRRPFEAELNAAKARRREADAKLAESEALLRSAQAQLIDAQAQAVLAGQRRDRATQLQRQNAISDEDVDQRESELQQAKAAIESAQALIQSAKAGIATADAAIQTAIAGEELAELNLSYTRIVAPIDGRISRRLVTQGNLISGGSEGSTLLTTIVSLDPIHCYFDADEQAFLKYARLSREGKRVSSRDAKNPVYMRLIDETGYPHVGHMDFVDNRIDPNTGTIRGRAIFSNSDNTLTPGLFAEVRLPGSGRYDAVLIPDDAISSDQSEQFVYVVVPQSASPQEPSAQSPAGSPPPPGTPPSPGTTVIARRAVQLGPIAKGLRVIRGGLDGSEWVVVGGVQKVFPGVAVDPKETVLQAESRSDLPDDYTPVSKENWIQR